MAGTLVLACASRGFGTGGFLLLVNVIWNYELLSVYFGLLGFGVVTLIRLGLISEPPRLLGFEFWVWVCRFWGYVVGCCGFACDGFGGCGQRFLWIYGMMWGA